MSFGVLNNKNEFQKINLKIWTMENPLSDEIYQQRKI